MISFVLVHILSQRIDDIVFHVLDKSFDECISDTLDALLEPDIVVKEVTLTSKNSKIYRKVVILAVNYSDETILDLLCDVKDS